VFQYIIPCIRSDYGEESIPNIHLELALLLRAMAVSRIQGRVSCTFGCFCSVSFD
jgi:hypothetical protein